MRFYTFQIVNDSGEISTVRAISRGMAIQRHSLDTGMSVEYIKKHCVVRNLG